jgi:hypothetical protein
MLNFEIQGFSDPIHIFTKRLHPKYDYISIAGSSEYNLNKMESYWAVISIGPKRGKLRNL